MSRDNIVQRKSFEFAVKAIKKAYEIQKEKNEFDLTRQFIRSASSIGANIEESMGGQSDRDFLNKLSISYKEARETDYWIRLMFELKLITKDEKESLGYDIEEILKLLGAIRRTMKSRIENS